MTTKKKAPPTAMLIEQNEGAKPRVRVQQGFDFRHYKNMNLPGNGQVMLPLTSGRTEAAYRDQTVRAVRDLDRNNELIRGGIDRKSNTVVGPTLRVNPMPNWRRLGMSLEWALEFSQQALDAFTDWANDRRALCDTEGHYQFGGLMWQAFRMLAGPDAEVAGVIHYDEERRDEYSTKWATHLQLIDPDRISNPLGKPDSTDLFKGRQLDRHGRMIGLHIKRSHPADPAAKTDDHGHEYVERETWWGRPMAFHWFFKRRPGMQRALSALVTSLRHVEMLNKFDDVTLQNAAMNAVLGVFLQTTMSPEEAAAHMAPADDGEGEGISAFETKLEYYDDVGITIGNQRVPVLGPNDKIEFQRQADAIPGADDFRNNFLRSFASALGVPFEQLSLDYSRANYSSTRASLIDAWRNVMFERSMFTQHVASLVYDAVIEEAFALGILTSPAGAPTFEEARGAYTSCSWTGPGMGWVDPLKEAKAARERKDGMFSTLEQENAAQGLHWRDTIDQQAMERSYCEQSGVPYDSEEATAEDPADETTLEEEEETEE